MSNVVKGTDKAAAIRPVAARIGLLSTAQIDGAGVGTVHRMSRANGGTMSAVPTNVGVFFGQVDKRAEGWYWADAQSEKLREQSGGRSRQRTSRWRMRFGAFGKPQMTSHEREAQRDRPG